MSHQLLDVATTNVWLKPRSYSSSISFTYGMPWEILRTDQILTDSDRGITLFTKSGGLEGYTSQFIHIPEYELGLTILVAGESRALNWLREKVIPPLIRGVEQITRDQTDERYAGTYKTPNVDDLNSSVVLEVQIEDGRCHGLVLTSWVSNGTDFLLEYSGLATGVRDLDRGKAQLVPSNVNRDKYHEAWMLDFLSSKVLTEPSAVADTCLINDVDTLMYGDRSLQEFLFISDVNGDINSVELPAFRVTLRKESMSKVEEYDGDQGIYKEL